jgi:hypothetical protein
MVTELQFLAVGAFLLWGLASALYDVLLPESMPDSGVLAVDLSRANHEPDVRPHTRA